ARLAVAEKPPAAGTPEKPGAASPEAALLDRVLHELAASQLLGGNRAALIAALEEYEARVRSPDPRRHAWVLLQLAQAKKRNGALEAARRTFQKCDQLYPRSIEARECREELAGMKG
ncbi:MAG: tetratricopeptide repeat protein, partial [Thermoanaerobaculia bacterium]